ncbi:hypothetical protein AB1Y20_010190 [Prymnesium parvum]|uniref:Sulfate transporter n=1 Tax=Prymnesium parvum TaxID=97485 RepID=A0AB34K6F6_PRYPA
MLSLARRLYQELTLAEISGSLGDVGTLIPLMLPLAQQGSIHFVPALFFSGLANAASGLLWDLPICVQPMKTIAAVALTEGLTAVQVSLAGLLVSSLVLLLGLSRAIVLVNNVIPDSVVRGIQIGLGLSLMKKGAALVLSTGSWVGAIDGYALASCCFVTILLLSHSPRVPVALILFSVGVVLAIPVLSSSDSMTNDTPPSPWPVTWALDQATPDDVWHALFSAALPQLPLTTLNSIISTCKLSHDLFPDRPRLSQTSVACSVGVMNIVACTLGGMPMCHGAGGLAAQYRFGARQGCSMVFLGVAKMTLALALGGALLNLLQAFPKAILGVLLIFSGLELAKAGARPLALEQDLTVAYLTAGATLVLKTGGGCVIGLLTALLCGGYKRGSPELISAGAVLYKLHKRTASVRFRLAQHQLTNECILKVHPFIDGGEGHVDQS